MASPIHTLPLEILTQLLIDVRSISKAALRSCLLVDRAWHKIATPIFYSTVVLENSHVTSFIQTCNARCYPLIYSLTLRIRAEKRFERINVHAGHDWYEMHATAVETSQKFQELKHIFPLITNLTTFSLYVDAHGVSVPPPKPVITRRCVVQLLGALPPSCIDLEIDTKSLESSEVMSGSDDDHICESFAKVLPRMRHARIKVLAACSSVVGEGPLLKYRVPQNAALFKPISMPKLKSFVVSAHFTDSGFPSREGCGSKPQDWYNDFHQSLLYRGLRQVLQQDSAVPRDAEVFMLFACFNSCAPKRWSGLVRARVTDETSLVTPFLGKKQLSMSGSKRYFVRLADEQRFTSLFAEVEQLAEGQLWKDFEGGERPPVAFLNGNCRDCHEYVRACREVMRPMTAEEAAFLRPKTEMKVGRKLIFPKTFDAVESVLIRPHLVEESE